MELLPLNAETHYCPKNRNYFIVLDPAEIFPDDPGQGTPALVHGPKDITGTFGCALDTGEVDGITVPNEVYAWLESITEYVDGWLNAATDRIRLGLK